MNKIYLLILSLMMIFITGCSNKSTTYKQTLPMISIDGSQTDYSKFDQYKKIDFCGNRDKSLISAANSAGIDTVRHVDVSTTTTMTWIPIVGTTIETTNCYIVYGE